MSLNLSVKYHFLNLQSFMFYGQFKKVEVVEILVNTKGGPYVAEGDTMGGNQGWSGENYHMHGWSSVIGFTVRGHFPSEGPYSLREYGPPSA